MTIHMYTTCSMVYQHLHNRSVSKASKPIEAMAQHHAKRVVSTVQSCSDVDHVVEHAAVKLQPRTLVISFKRLTVDLTDDIYEGGMERSKRRKRDTSRSKQPGAATKASALEMEPHETEKEARSMRCFSSPTHAAECQSASVRGPTVKVAWL